MINNNLKIPFYIRICCGLITILLLGYFAIIGQTILIPLILGILIAILLVPFCNFIERFLFLPRVVASILGTIIFFSLIVGVLFLLASQLASIVNEWPSFQKQITECFDDIQQWIYSNYGISSKKQIQYLNDNIIQSFDIGTFLLENIIASIARYSFLVIFSFLYIVFILIYRRHLIRFIFYVFHENQHKDVLSVIYTTQNMVKQYLIGLFLQILFVFGLTYISLDYLDIKYSFLIALVTGILNIIPYVGISASLLLSVFLTFATAGSSEVFLVVIAFIVVHAIDANIIMPKIVGSKVKVNSLMVVIGLVIGELTWGIMGMLLSIPILALTKIIFDHIPDLKPWGFLLGDEKNEVLNPNIEKYFRKSRTSFFRKQKKQKDKKKDLLKENKKDL